jgi:hypothetical protein
LGMHDHLCIRAGTSVRELQFGSLQRHIELTRDLARSNTKRVSTAAIAAKRSHRAQGCARRFDIASLHCRCKNLCQKHNCTSPKDSETYPQGQPSLPFPLLVCRHSLPLLTSTAPRFYCSHCRKPATLRAGVSTLVCHSKPKL